MPIFEVSTRDGAATMVIRARCISCARQIAVERSPAEEFAQWSHAVVRWVADPAAQGYIEDGVRGILKRVNHG